MFAYIMAPARRDGAGQSRVGGASFQPLHHLLPRHRKRAGRSVGTVVQLNSDGLDPAHGLVAVAATSFKFKVEIFKLDVT